MVLTNLVDIQKPVTPFDLTRNNVDLQVKIIDYYRCLDTLSGINQNPVDPDDPYADNGSGNKSSEEASESESDGEDNGEVNQYSRERQKELSFTQNMLIKIYGRLESGHSMTVNLQGFTPSFYLKVPDEWDKHQCGRFIKDIRKIVYFKYKNHLIKSVRVMRKPFEEFTGDDKFQYMHLFFKNKESYDAFAYKFREPIALDVTKGRPYHYKLYESNIEPIIKFIHQSSIDSAGWIKIPKGTYQIQKKKSFTATTDFEITMSWDQVRASDRMDNNGLNTAAFDIEADSSHGDFPIGIKDYQKLAQDLVTFYNECGVNTKKTKKHRLLQKSRKAVFRSLLDLVFNDDYNNNSIHQIKTVDNRKPHPQTVEQLAYTIQCLYEQYCTGNNADTGGENKNDIVHVGDGSTEVEVNIDMEAVEDERLSSEELIEQINDLFEYNLPATNLLDPDSSHYDLLAREITVQMFKLTKTRNMRFQEAPLSVIALMINLAFHDWYDAFPINCIYTKANLKPESVVLDAIVPDICRILEDCAKFVNFGKMPEPPTFATADGTQYNEDNMSQDAFVKLLVEVFNKNLPEVEGDKLIQIGTTCQLTGQSDCYLKHIICLRSCEAITNEEMIAAENADIYLPAEDLAKDLLLYERQLEGIRTGTGTGAGMGVGSESGGRVAPLPISDPDPDTFKALVKAKAEEIKKWDFKQRQEKCRIAAEYRRVKQSSTDKARVVVEFYDTEREILMAWKEFILINDPDIVVGYNTFFFDFKFLNERAIENGCAEQFCQLGRLKGCIEPLHEQKLSSAGLGDNILRYIPMNGRVLIDLYKVIQKDYKLGSYKLDSVCHKFLYKEKVDISPQEIFSLQKGSSRDRKKIAVYCLIDCVLCNRLISKLEIIGNNIAMANVCKVPFPYLFLRGQGVKIFSLVADYCAKEGFVIPVLPKADPASDDGYEGAIVLTPFTGIYFDPIAVGDFNSLYPSSMISENLSHDSFTEIGGKYDNLPGYTYTNIEYDVYKWVPIPGKKKKIKQKVGVKVCRYAQLPNGKKSILPAILITMLAARSAAKKKKDNEKDPFKAKLWDGLQMAYKVTANSLYGQCGAKTSPISKKEVAASTTAVGRNMIMFSKKHVEDHYKDVIIDIDTGKDYKGNPIVNKYTGMKVHVKDSYCVYGDTDSIFIRFNIYQMDGTKVKGLDAVFLSMLLCIRAAGEISDQLKKPQKLAFEKVIYPFILIAKKRYHGHYYTELFIDKYEAKSMGIATKRRDNAPIVTHIYGGCLDVIMKDHDIDKSLAFVKVESVRLLKGGFPLKEFVISKTLKSYYKKPNQIAHNVLANRQAQRDPGNRFETNDRVPYAFIIHQNPSKDHLQGDLIETPDYIKKNNIQLNYKMYLTNQIMMPVSQIFDLVPGFERTDKMFDNMIAEYENDRLGIVKLDSFFTKKARSAPSLKDLIEKHRISQQDLKNQIAIEDDDKNKWAEKGGGDGDEEAEETYESNYDNPDF